MENMSTEDALCHAASEAAHQLFEEAKAEDETILSVPWSLAIWSTG
jgi:hypothetical protein